MVFKFYSETEAAVPAPSFKQVSNHFFFLMGCHAGGTPIVNGVKKRTLLQRGEQKDEYKKAGGRGRRVNPTLNASPSLGLGRVGAGGFTGDPTFCVLFFL